MKLLSPGRYTLKMRLAGARFGWGPLSLAMIFILGSLCWLWWIPAQDSLIRVQTASINQQRHILANTLPLGIKAVISTTQQRLDNFYSALGERRHVDSHLRIIFELAQAAGIVFSKGEYKAEYDPASKSTSYQIQLPVTGTYSAILNFCEKVLLTIPFASLDELSVKRDRIGSQVLNVQLRFTLFLHTSPETPRLNVFVAMESNAP